MSGPESRYDVAIVGAGPVGLALAVELGQRQVSCVVIERRTEQQLIPKGQNLTQRTLDSFYSWGCADELRAERILPPGFPIAGITAYGNLGSEYWFAPPDRVILQDYFFQKNERLPQYLTERVLARRLAELPSAEVRRGWTALSLAVGEDGADSVLELRNPAAPGTTETVAARYVVGCDGARSMIRETTGIQRSGSDYGQPMLLTVFRSPDLAKVFSRFPPATTYRALNPELRGYWQFFGRVDASEQWFFHAPADPAVTDHEQDARAQIRAAAGAEVEIDFQHVGVWDLRVQVAETYRAGGVFIAGDAAHNHPPYGGYGLNTGLEDVRNLGWKLEAVLRGWGGERLLESYSEERQPVFAQTGEEVIAAGIAKDREFLERHRPEDGRAEFEAAWSDFAARQHTPLQYEPHYAGSSVVFGDPEDSPGVWGRYAFEARPGHHLTGYQLPSGRNVYELLGRHFTLLCLGEGAQPEADAFAARADRLGVPLSVVKETSEAARDFYQAPLVLVRPDSFVAWAGDRATAAQTILERVAGRVRSSPAR